MQHAIAQPDLQQLRQLWAEVLQVPLAEVGADSHFLLLGGDSLQLVRLLGRLREDFGLALPSHELVRFATPARMLAYCRVTEPEGIAELPPAPASGPVQRVTATPVQQGLWLAEQLAAPAQLYLASVLVYLSGPLQLAALQQAVERLFRQYPVLGGRLLHLPQTRALELDLAAQPSLQPQELLPVQECPESQWPQALQAVASEPMLLEQGPLCRLLLLRSDACRHVLLLSCHHVISDGWSGGILLRQLAAGYAAALQAAPPPLRAPDRRFADYCLRHATEPVAVESRLEAWRKRLAGLETAQQWLWRQGSAETWPHHLAMQSVTVPAALVARLRSLARALHCSLFCCFLDAVCVALQLFSAERRQVLLLPLAQRQPHEEQSVGCYVETLLLVADWSSDLAPAQALRAASAAFDSARRDQLPLATLAAGLRPRLLPDGNPWSSILFAYQSFPHSDALWPGLQHCVERLPVTHGQHALKLEVLPGADDWHLRIEYAESLLTPLQIAQLIDSCLARLHCLVGATRLPVST